jgi:hypothetical protein
MTTSSVLPVHDETNSIIGSIRVQTDDSVVSFCFGDPSLVNRTVALAQGGTALVDTEGRIHQITLPQSSLATCPSFRLQYDTMVDACSLHVVTNLKEHTMGKTVYANEVAFDVDVLFHCNEDARIVLIELLFVSQSLVPNAFQTHTL